MRKLLALVIAAPLLIGCSTMRMPWTKPEPLPQASVICPSWVDKAAAPSAKRKLAGELKTAPQDAMWPEVVVEGVKLTDQLIAAGCRPVGSQPEAPKQ